MSFIHTLGLHQTSNHTSIFSIFTSATLSPARLLPRPEYPHPRIHRFVHEKQQTTTIPINTLRSSHLSAMPHSHISPTRNQTTSPLHVPRSTSNAQIIDQITTAQTTSYETIQTLRPTFTIHILTHTYPIPSTIISIPTSQRFRTRSSLVPLRVANGTLITDPASHRESIAFPN